MKNQGLPRQLLKSGFLTRTLFTCRTCLFCPGHQLFHHMSPLLRGLLSCPCTDLLHRRSGLLREGLCSGCLVNAPALGNWLRSNVPL